MKTDQNRVIHLLNSNDNENWQRASFIMLGWHKRQQIEALTHAYAYKYLRGEYPMKDFTNSEKVAIKRTLISSLSKRKMRPRYLFGDLLIPMHINKRKAKIGLLITSADKFSILIMDIIKNNSISDLFLKFIK